MSERIRLGHGGGGTLMQQLIEKEFRRLYRDPAQLLHDAATLDLPPGQLAFSTDSYVVHPLEFPGGIAGGRGEAALPAAKLAQEQGWTLARSERVIQEYRRFLFLALEAGHPVSPSQAVDMAWHQHLLDTRQYWEEFCPQVLGRPLHHIPSRGGEEERQRMGKWYRDTLRSYHVFFGAPPAEIWPVCDGVGCPSAGFQQMKRGRWWGLRWVLKLGSTAAGLTALSQRIRLVI